MQVEEGFLERPDGRLYYQVAGSGDPLLFIHGFTLDHRMWDPQFETFVSRYRVVRCDLRGFGRSSVPSGPYRHVDDLNVVLDHLAIDRAHVVGLSLGGATAVDFALAYPGKVRSLVLVDSVLNGYRWAQGGNAVFGKIRSAAAEEGVAAARQIWLGHPFFAPALQQTGVSAALNGIVGEYSGWHWLNRDPGTSPEPAAAERLGEIRAPALVIVGDRDTADLQRIADVLAGGIPGAKKEVLPGAGHMANMEAPARFNDLVLAFLAGK